MNCRLSWRTRVSILCSALFSIGTVQAAPCDNFRVLVSGYFSNVHIYDACTGQFQRNLDDTGRIQGAQAVKLGPDGRLWVVSEEAGTILRYDFDTFNYIDTFARLEPNWDATGLTFDDTGGVYVSSYSTGALRRYNVQTGVAEAVPVAGASVLAGPDNGMLTGPDDNIYVPGYDSHNVVRYDPDTQQYSQFVPPRDNGLRAARGLLLNVAEDRLYVSGERSNQILRYRFPEGGLDKVVNSSITSPTGMAWDFDGNLLVAGNGRLGSGVIKIDPETGEEKSLFIPLNSGGLSGPTYIAMIPRRSVFEEPNPATLGSQYWLTALGRLNGSSVELEANTALGTYFGEDFDPAEVNKPRWGKIRLEFTSCTEAQLRWESTGDNSARFGDGGYRIERMLITPATVDCRRTGIAGAPNTNWVQGAWYGGPSRDGEGFMLDTDGNGLVFLTWFTYRPAQP
ncbi:MAG: hypothetical protein JNN30_05580 [Rhodanobacteraceae bacterium]|nr:hypothetical protein [Rhodanobacteraceae bacterium]